MPHPVARLPVGQRPRCDPFAAGASCFVETPRVRLLDAEAPELAKHGEVGRGRTKDRVDNINSKGGTSPDYTLARLKRDRPDLAQQVVNGELSANAAAITNTEPPLLHRGGGSSCRGSVGNGCQDRRRDLTGNRSGDVLRIVTDKAGKPDLDADHRLIGGIAPHRDRRRGVLDMDNAGNAHRGCLS